MHFEHRPGWSFTVWQRSGGDGFEVTATSTTAREFTTVPRSTALEALNDALADAGQVDELLKDLAVLVDAGLIAPVAP